MQNIKKTHKTCRWVLGLSVNNCNVCVQEECLPIDDVHFGASLTLACFDALSFDWSIDGGWMDNLETNRQAKRNIHLYLAKCIFACYVSSEGCCDILSATTQRVSRYKHLQICTLVCLGYGRLSNNDVNICFESTRTPFFNCIPPVAGVILWHDENCCKQVCRQKIDFHQALGNGRFTLDNGRKSQDYIYGE